MSAPSVDLPRLTRLFRFIREHQEQARRSEDWVRAMKWDSVSNKLLDHMLR